MKVYINFGTIIMILLGESPQNSSYIEGKYQVYQIIELI